MKNCIVNYIKNNPQRFTKTLISEYRGNYNEDDKNLFWQYVVSKKYQSLNYFQYAKLLFQGRESEIIERLKKQIWIDRMPNTAKKLVNVAHPESIGSIKLFRRDFVQTNHIVYSSGAPIFYFDVNRII